MTAFYDLTRATPEPVPGNTMMQTMRIAGLIVSLWERGDPAHLQTVLGAFAVFNLEDLPENTISKARIIELWPHALDLAITCAHMHDFDIPITIPEFIASTGE